MSSSRNPAKRILVGFDGSPGAEDAIELARVFRTPDSELLLVHVVSQVGPIRPSFFALGRVDTPEAKEFFRSARDALGGSDVQVRSYYGGSPAHVLTQIAEEEKFDLIIVGSPHRGVVGKALLGSVARGLMHGAPAPTITAPRDYAARAHDPIHVIAVSYDGMPEAEAALREATALRASTPTFQPRDRSSKAARLQRPSPTPVRTSTC